MARNRLVTGKYLCRIVCDYVDSILYITWMPNFSALTEVINILNKCAVNRCLFNGICTASHNNFNSTLLSVRTFLVKTALLNQKIQFNYSEFILNSI